MLRRNFLKSLMVGIGLGANCIGHGKKNVKSIGGTFTLSSGGGITTEPIRYDASPETIQQAINRLPNIQIDKVISGNYGKANAIYFGTI